MNGDRHHNGRISMWLIRQSTKRKERRMHDPYEHDPGMRELHARDLRNEASPAPAPVIQHVDITDAVDAGDMEPAEIVKPDGDGDWAVKASEHVKAERARIHDEDDADPATFKTASPYRNNDGKDDYGNPKRHRGDEFVSSLPAEDGAEVDDHCDDGFIPRDDESSEEAHTRFHVERDGEHDGHTHG